MGQSLQVETSVLKVASDIILSLGVYTQWHKLHITHGYKKAWRAENCWESVFLIILLLILPEQQTVRVSCMNPLTEDPSD